MPEVVAGTCAAALREIGEFSCATDARRNIVAAIGIAGKSGELLPAMTNAANGREEPEEMLGADVRAVLAPIKSHRSDMPTMTRAGSV
jgi:hypothetical protein